MVRARGGGSVTNPQGLHHVNSAPCPASPCPSGGSQVFSVPGWKCSLDAHSIRNSFLRAERFAVRFEVSTDRLAHLCERRHLNMR